jgi:large subunit ribosomal protein L32e
MTDAKLLQIKLEKNKRRPKFIRQDYHHRKKVQKDSWRAPKGVHSKMREHRKSRRPLVAVGYRNPVLARGLHKSGAKFAYVSNVLEMQNVNPKESVVVVNGKLGARKKYLLLKKALEKSIPVASINAKKFIEAFEAKLKAKQEAKSAKKVVEKKAEEKKPEAKAPEKKGEPQTKEMPKAQPKLPAQEVKK